MQKEVVIHRKAQNCEIGVWRNAPLRRAKTKSFGLQITSFLFFHSLFIFVLAAETKTFQPIPIIADFTDEAGKDLMQQAIEDNYNQIKADVKEIVTLELKRISEDPELKHLIKKQ